MVVLAVIGFGIYFGVSELGWFDRGPDIPEVEWVFVGSRHEEAGALVQRFCQLVAELNVVDDPDRLGRLVAEGIAIDDRVQEGGFTDRELDPHFYPECAEQILYFERHRLRELELWLDWQY